MSFKSNIMQTIATRGGVAVANFAVILITLNVLGAEGRGQISIFLTDIALVIMVSNILAGSTIAYHAPRTRLLPLLKYGYLWGFIVCTIGSSLLFLVHQEELQIHVFGVSILQSFTVIHQMVLVGKEQMSKYNLTFVLTPILTIALVLSFFYVFDWRSVEAFALAQYIGFGITWILSIFLVTPLLRVDENDQKVTFNKVVRYGFGTEISAVVQFLNYRLIFYVIHFQLGDASLGLFSVAVALTESVWILSRSIVVNQYSKIINSSNALHKRVLTKMSLSYTALFCGVALLVLCFIPASWFNFIINKDVHQIKELIYYLAPGSLAIAISNAYGHYFSGTGKFLVNNYKSMIGLVSMLVIAFFTVDHYGLVGGAMAMTIGYLLSSLSLFGFYTFERK